MASVRIGRVSQVVGDRVEVGGDLLDPQLRRRDLRPAELDQFRRPGDPLGEMVDVDVGTLEFAQDAVEFGEGGRVAGLGGRRR